LCFGWAQPTRISLKQSLIQDKRNLSRTFTSGDEPQCSLHAHAYKSRQCRTLSLPLFLVVFIACLACSRSNFSWFLTSSYSTDHHPALSTHVYRRQSLEQLVGLSFFQALTMTDHGITTTAIVIVMAMIILPLQVSAATRM
jgi:hypothetical protein